MGGSKLILVSIVHLCIFISITSASVNLSLAPNYEDCTFHLTYFGQPDLASNLIIQNKRVPTTWTVSTADNNVTNKYKYFYELCDINLIVNSDMEYLFLSSGLIFSLRAHNPRSVFLFFWESSHAKTFLHHRVKFRNAQFYVFHVKTTEVKGAAVCSWELEEEPTDILDEGRRYLKLGLTEIPQGHGLLHPVMQIRIENCKKNLNGKPVHTLDSSSGIIRPRFKCNQFTNYFSQPNCGWNTDELYFVFAILWTRFNFTRVFMNDRRQLYSGIITPATVSDFRMQANLTSLMRVEKNLYIIYREPKTDIRRRAMSFKFWFKPFDFFTWVLIIR